MTKKILVYTWGILCSLIIYLYSSKNIVERFPQYNHPDSGLWFLLMSILAVLLVSVGLRFSRGLPMWVQLTLPFPVGLLASGLALLIGNILMW